jgi:hypothetical protein
MKVRRKRHKWGSTGGAGLEQECGLCGMVRRYVRAEKVTINKALNTVSLRVKDVPVYSRNRLDWERAERVPPCEQT